MMVDLEKVNSSLTGSNYFESVFDTLRLLEKRGPEINYEFKWERKEVLKSKILETKKKTLN